MNNSSAQPTKVDTNPLNKKGNPTEIRPINAPLFPKVNLIMMGGCILLIILGFILMGGGSSSVENGFNPDIFSTRRIVVGPALAFLGFLLMAFAIIWTPKKKSNK